MSTTTASTHDEFKAALMRCDVPAYKWGEFGSVGYHPSWLAPDGKIVWGDSHASIARDTVGGGYGDMYDAGYLRLQPGYRRDHFSIEGEGNTHITPQMRVTLAKLLRQFKPSKNNDLSFVAVAADGSSKVVHSAKEFLQACMDAYGG